MMSLVLCLSVGLFAAGCNQTVEPAAAPVRLSLEEAETLIRGAILAENPDLDPEVAFTLEERTPPELWQRMGAQLFRMGGPLADFRSAETYIIVDGQADRLGLAFGGYGVTSTAIADLAQDGEPELLYTYSWGSGLHRSHLAVYPLQHPEKSPVDAALAYLDGDLILEKVDDQTVLIRAGYYDEKMVFVEGALLGQVQLGGEGDLTISLEEDVPSGVRKRLVSSLE